MTFMGGKKVCFSPVFITSLHRGYWHGTVQVYQRSLRGSEDRKDFVSEVKNLCKIRHENIQLFMGVCIDVPGDGVAVVMRWVPTVCMCICMCICMCVYVCVCICVCMCVYVYMCMCVYVCVCQIVYISVSTPILTPPPPPPPPTCTNSLS